MHISIAELVTGFVYLSCHYTCMCALVNIHTIHVHTCVCVCVCVYVYARVCICTFMCVHMYTILWAKWFHLIDLTAAM